MAARINELTQFTDEGGKPIVNGKIYIGTVGLDPVANLITIYSDRALTTPLANPQLLDAEGRSTNKIWIPGKYSMQVNDELAVQQVQDLDAGEDQSAGITTLTSIQGSNTITAEGIPAITGYIDKQQYTFIVASVNTGAVTINIDAIGAKTIKRNFDQDIVTGQFQANQAVIVMFNEAQDIMEWVNHNNKVDYWRRGADIASAATVDLSLATGNSLVVTGATGPITSFGTTPQGSLFLLSFFSSPTINHNATSLIIPGQANIAMTQGDQILVQSLGSGNVQIQVFRQTGKALVETALFNNMEVITATGASTWTQPDGVTKVVVELGAGGGAGAGTTAGNETGGGGSGSVLRALCTVSSDITVTIGAGAVGDTDGGATGGDSTFGSLMTAKGGVGGVDASAGAGGPGGLLSSTTTTQTLLGKNTGSGAAGVDTISGGAGGDSGPLGGNGALIQTSIADGNDARSASGGGSGVRSSGTNTGGDGGDGFAIIWW